jgi:aerobic carbon-monoxide dehydrogenase large subunit
MTTAAEAPTTLVGEPVRRVEDPSLITGAAKYLDDLKLSGMAYVAILRSPYAHARITSIDTSAAEAAPGVIAVFTGKDFEHLPPLPCAWQAGGVENFVNTPRALEIDRVTFTGAGVAAVVAETKAAAEDARELIDVDWGPLDVVVDVEDAAADGALQLHENAPGNIAMDWSVGDAEATDTALGEAEVVVKQRLVNQRLIPNPMEARGAAATYEPATGQYTVWMTSQDPHIMRLLMTAFVFGIPETKMRCIALHVGGGFGTKIFLYHEYVLMAAIAEKVGRPVKWMETRSENYAATTHGRDHVAYVEIGGNRNGTITALKAKTFANMGGVLSTIAPGIPTTLYGRMLSGAYRTPNIYCQVLGMYTNTGMVDAYRGAGRPEATYVVERSVDLFAKELGLDPVDVRRRNFIPPDAFPYDPVGILRGLKYDSGDYEKALDRALEIVDYEGFRREQDETRKQGRYRGIGFSTYVEICGAAPSAWIGAVGEGWGASMWESANIRVHLTGKVAVTIGTQPQGQGHATTVSQIVASELGIPIEDVTVEIGDTLNTPFGYGTYASRSAAVGAVAVYKSLQKIKAKARRLAAHMLEADEDDIVLEGGKAFVKGAPDNAKTIQEIAGAAALAYDLPEGEEPFLDDTTYYDPPDCTFPFGTHIAVVEIDPETGEVKLERYIAVDDVGKVINPMIVDGQIQGGIAQGIAQALWEYGAYDESGQLVTASMMDYAVPKAEFYPSFELDRTETPTDVNPLGVKGVGETGTIASTPAVVNAVMDALAPLGIRHVDMPLTPERVWRAMREAKNGGGEA